ncbi:MAG: LTA synthase family protein [Clostridiales bacterium]|nr:LTA synthase family protein [Clostridiales bacterium]
MERVKNFINNIDKSKRIKIGLFLIPLLGIIIKSIFLQCFIQSQNPYKFDLVTGYLNSSAFLLYYLAFALVSLSFSFLFKGKGRVIYIFIIDGIITILTLLDVMYFRGFLTVPSVLILTQTANLDNLSGTVFSMLSPLDILFFLDLIILGVYVFLTRKYYKNFKKRAPKAFLLTLIIPLIYILYIPFNINVLKNEDVKNAYLFDGMDPTNTTKYFTSLGYHIMDLYTVYRDSKPYELTDEEKESIEYYYNWKNENLGNNEYAGLSKNKNLILIQVESLESFIIGQEINGQKITPVLDNIINNGLYFPNIYEQVNEGTSSDCDFMMNTSLLPLRRGSTFFRYPNNDYVSMPKILASNGYETASIHPDKGSFWNYANALKGGIGFENFFDYFSFNPDELIGMGLSDESYFNQVIPKLKEFKTPFFAHTITLTNHGPFALPDEKRIFNLDSELNKSELGGYIESVHYTDTQIGKFIENLKNEGLLDNSIIVITGDHGGVHKYYNHSIEQLTNKEDWFKIKDDISTVPFIIYDTSITEGKTFDTIGGQIDLMPTILCLLGIDSSEYENTSLGRNLLNTNRSFAVTTNGTVFGEDLTPETEDIIYSSLELSDKIIRSNYFKR